MSSTYKYITIHDTDPMFSMASRQKGKYSHTGVVAEHRLVMARFLGRPLTNIEVVHHRDGNGMNNVISNLQLGSNWQEHDIIESKIYLSRQLEYHRTEAKHIEDLLSRL